MSRRRPAARQRTRWVTGIALQGHGLATWAITTVAGLPWGLAKIGLAPSARWRALPFRIHEGKLLLATPYEAPWSAHAELKRFTHLEVRFQLVSSENFERLWSAI